MTAFTTSVSLKSRILDGTRAYAGRLRLFRRNARLYLLNTIIAGLSLGVFHLLFNFYVLSLGYDEALLGQLLTTSSLVALVGALPVGYFRGSLAMGIGFLSAPPLADRWGKIRLVVVTQALSIPFLFMLGFAPWFGLSACAYLVRQMLMNMSAPVYQAFVMERVEREARATVASLVSMCWILGWSFSPTLSGWLQVRHGFHPVFMGTISAYIVAIYLYWRFFWRDAEASL